MTGPKWSRLPDGTLLQWGYVSGFSGYTVTLPLPYADMNAFQVVATCEGTVQQPGTARAFVETVNTAAGIFTLSTVNSEGVPTARAVKWFAIGRM
ncbi:gp53-like domain-containing protein [Serratia nevei]